MEVVRNLASLCCNFLGEQAGRLMCLQCLDVWLGFVYCSISPFLNALADKLQVITHSLAPCHHVRGNLFSFAQICSEFSYLFEHPLSNVNIELSAIISRGGRMFVQSQQLTSVPMRVCVRYVGPFFNNPLPAPIIDDIK